MITKNGFENFKFYNICPENASIKFDKRDKKKNQCKIRTREPQIACLLFNRLSQADIYPLQYFKPLRERKSCGILAVPYPKTTNIDEYSYTL